MPISLLQPSNSFLRSLTDNISSPFNCPLRSHCSKNGNPGLQTLAPEKFQDFILHYSSPHSLDTSHTCLSYFQTHLAHTWFLNFVLAVLPHSSSSLSPDAHMPNFSILFRSHLQCLPWPPSLKLSYLHLSLSFHIIMFCCLCNIYHSLKSSFLFNCLFSISIS